MHSIACKQAPTFAMRDLSKGHEALRRGRVSTPGGEYFLTICTAEKRVGLTSLLPANGILNAIRAMDADATWQLRCAVVMPDHVHLLIVLGERLTLGKCVARLKAKTAAPIRTVHPQLDWERDFFDRHLRADEDRLSLFLYIHLNPYRAGLCGRQDRWPWYYCREEDWKWFKDYLQEDRPVPAWLL